MNIYSIKTTIQGREAHLLSIIDPAIEKEIKLSDKCILGFLREHDKPATPENIAWNKKFLDHFHKTIVFFTRFSDQVISMAEKEQQGFIFITDKRNPESESPKPQDIIGSFAVLHGRVIEESYEPNPAYELISSDGPFVLQKELEALLYNTAY